MSDAREPAEVFSLAEYLCEEMQARGWTTADVAIRMSGEYGINKLALDLFMAVQDDRLTVGDNEFDNLAAAFGVSSEYFRNLDAVWRAWPDRRVPFDCPESIFGPDA